MNSNKRISRGLVLSISAVMLATAGTTTAQTVVFYEDWETDHSLDNTYVTNYTAVGANLADLFFDYSTVGVPLSPHSTNNNGRGAWACSNPMTARRRPGQN